jgi:acyl-coenzyme A synthetase/AMP-(fatty) acid ligase
VNDFATSPLTLRDPADIIIRDHARCIDLEEFLALASEIAAELPDHEHVFNLCSNRCNYMFGFFAAILAGQCTLMPPNRVKRVLGKIREEYPDSYVLADGEPCDYEIGAKLRSLSGRSVGTRSCPQIPDDQLCAIAFTSGSTGLPRPNRKYWKTLRCGSLSNSLTLLNTLRRPATILSTVPPQHMWGLETAILLPLFGNVSIGCGSPFYPQDIKEALEALSEPRVLVSTPFHLQALYESALPLPSVELVLSATAPLSPELANRLESRLDARVMEVFGCTESGIIASRFLTREESWSLADPFRLDIVDGRAQISADHLPEKVCLMDEVEGLPDQKFRWLGRHQDMVNIAGKRASLADINRRLLNIPGVADGIVFLPNDSDQRLAALVVAPNLVRQELLEALRTEIDPVFLPRPLLLVDQLPRSASGKLPKDAVLAKFENARMERGSRP